MSEVTPRSSAPRGRGSGRGGRGGYSSRGGRPRHANGDKADVTPAASYEDEGEIGQLKKQYASKLTTIKEMFPDWTDEDIVFALQETGGDLEGTIERISEGNISQWGEVKKKSKDRARSKVKDANTDGTDSAPRNRGGRGRGGDGHRGGRDRANERGGSSTRGRGGNSSNGPRKQNVAEPTTAAAATADGGPSWDTPADNSADSWERELLANQGGTASPDASWEMVTPSEAAPPPVPETQKPSIPDGTRSWASMLKPAPKPKPVPAKSKVVPAAAAELANTEASPQTKFPSEKPESPAPLAAEQPVAEDSVAPPSPAIPSEPSAALTPSKDELTETNLEKVEDVSNPVATATAASTAGTNEPRSTVATPLNTISQQQGGLRPGLGGFATTAYKATAGSGRSASYQRRVKEQQEAVVMPGNHAVDRAAVQFGSLGLNGNSDELDVDDEREDAETRTQPPQHSPVAPRASLPPAPQQPPTEAIAASRPAPGLPPVASQAPQVSQTDNEQAQTASHGGYGYSQFNNMYGAPASHPEATSATTKSYEPFGQQVQQATAHQPFEGYPSSQAPNQPGGNSTHQSHLGGFTTAGNDYSSYYTSDSQRNAYPAGFYGSSYGQQSQPAPHEAGNSQQRGTGAFGTSGPEQPSLHATSQPQQPPQGRYGTTNEAQNSGHSTPNPVGGQQLHGQGQQSHQMGQSHGQGQHGAYPYGAHPYYGSPYYSPYMNQFNYGGNQGAYGSGSYGGGKFGQPQHQAYGISPQSSYDPHSASPANAGSYGQPQSIPSRDTGSTLYGRTGSAQPSEGQQHNTSSFSSMPESFSRLQSGYPGQGTSQQASQQNNSEDSSRGFSDSTKVAGGPSPAPGQAGRPGSATNNMQGQSGLPTTQGQSQQGYSGYQSQMGHQMPGQQSHYGSGLGGLGHHQSGAQNHQSTGYGGYGGGFGGNYYNSSNRGGWGGNYGH